MDSTKTPLQTWTFLTNHSHVLLYLSQHPDSRLRDVAAAVGITERAVQRIVTELEETGYLRKIRQGRQNSYQIEESLPLRHPIEQHCTIHDLIRFVQTTG